MKKMTVLLLSLLMLISLTSCKAKQETPEEEANEWSRTGFFTDENENLLSIMKSDLEDYPGWYVGGIFGDEMFGWYLPQEGNKLHGDLIPDYEDGHLIATVSEEGEDGVLLEIEGGEKYHFVPTEIPEAPIGISVNTEGLGLFTAVSDAEGAFEAEDPVSSMILSLYDPAVYTLTAVTAEGGEDWSFVKWTRNGNDYSTDPVLTIDFAESADYVAVFEWQGE